MLWEEEIEKRRQECEERGWGWEIATKGWETISWHVQPLLSRRSLIHGLSLRALSSPEPSGACNGARGESDGGLLLICSFLKTQIATFPQTG